MKRTVRRKVKRMVFHPEGESAELLRDMEVNENFKVWRPRSQVDKKMSRLERILKPETGPWVGPPYNIRRVYIPPDEFIKATYDQYGGSLPYDKYVSIVRKEEGRYDTVDSMMKKLARSDIPVDVPYLVIYNGEPISHERRNSALAAKEMGMERIPVILIYAGPGGLGRFGKYIKQQRARKRTMLDRAVRVVRR